MIKLYTVTKKKTNIKGFWKDEKGKIFIDNIKIKSFCSYPRKEIISLFNNGEKAIFCAWNDKHALIVDYNYNKSILKHCITWNEKHLKPSYIKELLNQHSGMTIYRNEGNFTIEIWKE